jgi:hypothetical protein
MKIALTEAVLGSELILLSGERVKTWNLQQGVVAMATSLGQVRFPTEEIRVNKAGQSRVADLKGHHHILHFYEKVTPIK